MSKKKRRDKRYMPRPVSAIGGLFAIDAAHEAARLRKPMSGDQITDLGIAYQMAFKLMTNGHADEQQWSTCVCSLNIAQVLAESGIGEEGTFVIKEALDGAFRARVRASRTGKWGFDGPAMISIQYAFELHEQQLKMATKEEIRDAMREVHRRIDEGTVYQEAA